jgi:hypothetical protein
MIICPGKCVPLQGHKNTDFLLLQAFSFTANFAMAQAGGMKTSRDRADWHHADCRPECRVRLSSGAQIHLRPPGTAVADITYSFIRRVGWRVAADNNLTKMTLNNSI